jgi:hypothetical protein
MQHVFERYSVDPQRCALAGGRLLPALLLLLPCLVWLA